MRPLLTRTDRLPRLTGTFIPLLTALVAVVVLAPLVEHHPLISATLISLLLLTGVFTVHHSPPLRLTAVLGLLVAIILRWSTYFTGHEETSLIVLSHLAAGVYMAFLAAVVFFTVLTHKEITSNTVLGAVCGYLLIAYVFSFCYLTLEVSAPGSIAMPPGSVPAEGSPGFRGAGPVLMYFSFTTLTTLGYGDVVPVSPLARSLASLEMVGGQLYLAAFVARLVGVMKAGRDRGPDHDVRDQEGSSG